MSEKARLEVHNVGPDGQTHMPTHEGFESGRRHLVTALPAVLTVDWVDDSGDDAQGPPCMMSLDICCNLSRDAANPPWCSALQADVTQ